MEKLSNVEWGKFKLGKLFNIVGTKSLDSNAITFVKDGINFVGRTFENNGIQGQIDRREFEPNEPYTITATVIGNYKYVKFQKEPYYCSQNINKLTPNSELITRWNEKIAYFFISYIQKFVSMYDNQQGGYKLDDIKNHIVEIPVAKGKINFDFMEYFVLELEKVKIKKLNKHLKTVGLDNYELTEAEKCAINSYSSLKWDKFNLKKLFGESTRGKRLKSDDRIPGNLPFITAGETNQGFSDYVGNKVEIFSENTTTIDMFGSAKYRNYKYGADDHVAVVHTEKLPKNAAIFVTSACHKSAHNGQFSYGKNFYAKDADELYIKLPVKNNQPDYEYMELLISAVHKIVIKDVVHYAENKIAATTSAVNSN